MDGPFDTPMPRGMAWNMIYDPDPVAGIEPPVTHDVLWQRLSTSSWTKILPIAEEAGVTLAAHPDDPPMPTMRGQPRLVYQPDMYQRLLDLHPSRASALEFCIGTLAEMTEGNVYDATAQYSSHGKLAYVHFRNIRGKVPNYKETFVDDGDIDMLRVLKILKANDFRGVLIPDHTPQMICGLALWHAKHGLRARLHAVCVADNWDQRIDVAAEENKWRSLVSIKRDTLHCPPSILEMHVPTLVGFIAIEPSARR